MTNRTKELRERMSKSTQTVQTKLSDYIKLHKMSESDFAEYVNIKSTTISRYLTNKGTRDCIPTLNNLLKLSSKMGITVSELIGEETTTAPQGENMLYKVIRVVDGDTIIVNYEGEDTRVRLIGIDTPESVHPDKSKNIPEGTTASDYTKSLLDDTSVYLAFDKQKFDRYNRLLAYVYLPDSTFLNAHLLEIGMANIATFKPNVMHLELFESIVSERE